MTTGLPLASGKAEIFEFVLKFLPDWVQITVIALVVLFFVARWLLKLKRRIAYRRAVRQGRPIHAAAQYGQGRGADHLGDYAPRQSQEPRGADFLGTYAPAPSQRDTTP